LTGFASLYPSHELSPKGELMAALILRTSEREFAMMAELTVTWSPDDDYLGTLDVQVQSAGFAGHSYAWFDKAHLKKTFVAALRTYPLDADSPPLLEGNDLVSAEATKSLRIAVTPYDLRGTLVVRVDLASWGDHSPKGDTQHMLTARFLTEYGMLVQFAADLEALLDGTKDAATLRGQE
jgi:hypothetical protein